MPDHLITPHGGVLRNLIVSDARAQELREASRDWPSWDLTERQICDLELLLNGAFSPLEGFMDRETTKGSSSKCASQTARFGPYPSRST